jgi:hypothetical protein
MDDKEIKDSIKDEDILKISWDNEIECFKVYFDGGLDEFFFSKENASHIAYSVIKAFARRHANTLGRYKSDANLREIESQMLNNLSVLHKNF